MKKSFFTRLTPNLNKWQYPSGFEGKCGSSNRLYEGANGFGWEEWLFENYHSGEDLCFGFLQAFNGKNAEMTSVEVIHLYTRICDGVEAKQYYVGCIKDVKVLSKGIRAASEEIKTKRLNDLERAGINYFSQNDSMWKNCFNIQFKRKNVFLMKCHKKCEIALLRGQFRFALYPINDHPNFLNQISNFQ